MGWSDPETRSPEPGPIPCTGCDRGHLRRDTVSTALWQDETLLVVEDVPALVCNVCGERYFEDETAIALDMIRSRPDGNQEPLRTMPVPVFSFAAPRGPVRRRGQE